MLLHRSAVYSQSYISNIVLQVMGLMLGEFVDDYTVNVIDVFAMPQSGTVKFTSK